MDLQLAGRSYIVTGGTSGLGRATAAALVDEGAHVVISSRGRERVEATAAALGEQAIGVVVDNADAEAPARLAAAALEGAGRLDGALISVGGPPAGGLRRVSEDDWRQAFESVFLGAIRLATQIASHLGEGGAIGLVLSSSVKTPLPGLSISNGLRPGLAMLAKDMADELGPSGIRVFGLVPGRLLTPRVLELEGGDLEVRKRSEASIPLRRLGQPEEFGRMAAILLSPAASYITGCVIPVDGGMIRSL